MHLYFTRSYERAIRKLLKAHRDDLTAADRKALARLVAEIERERQRR
ncbi:MAG: hypothetical protein OXF93_16985 [Acidobacteria bacterium]|nr:hypothetical protein [Acidobacteriota bacterium]